MILQGVGHPISCLGVCYVNDPKKGGYMTPAPALDLTTSLRGDFFAFFVTCPDEKIGFQCTNKSLPEEDECTQASHYNITGLGVVTLMGKMHCAPTKPATRRRMHKLIVDPLCSISVRYTLLYFSLFVRAFLGLSFPRGAVMKKKTKTRSVQYALRWLLVGNRWRLVGNQWQLEGNCWG